ncbi:MAG: hypothetical protein HC807_01915 [Gammaproteobacteria bacterium]|nr:hypothetical protein [Gammaproteobacteria bacterium]
MLLDGREIGQHQYTLRTEGKEHELRSDANFDVRILFVSAYRYDHSAVERWKDGCLQSLDARTVTNGEREAVSAAARGDRLVVEGPSGRGEHAGCVKSFAYWDPQILRARRLLNSQTGELLPVTVTPQGAETVEVRGERLAADRHRITGPSLRIDVWYANGQWVGLEAATEGGRRLRYELL